MIAVVFLGWLIYGVWLGSAAPCSQQEGAGTKHCCTAEAKNTYVEEFKKVQMLDDIQSGTKRDVEHPRDFEDVERLLGGDDDTQLSGAILTALQSTQDGCNQCKCVRTSFADRDQSDIRRLLRKEESMSAERRMATATFRHNTDNTYSGRLNSAGGEHNLRLDALHTTFLGNGFPNMKDRDDKAREDKDEDEYERMTRIMTVMRRMHANDPQFAIASNHSMLARLAHMGTIYNPQNKELSDEVKPGEDKKDTLEYKNAKGQYDTEHSTQILDVAQRYYDAAEKVWRAQRRIYPGETAKEVEGLATDQRKPAPKDLPGGYEGAKKNFIEETVYDWMNSVQKFKILSTKFRETAESIYNEIVRAHNVMTAMQVATLPRELTVLHNAKEEHHKIAELVHAVHEAHGGYDRYHQDLHKAARLLTEHGYETGNILHEFDKLRTEERRKDTSLAGGDKGLTYQEMRDKLAGSGKKLIDDEMRAHWKSLPLANPEGAGQTSVHAALHNTINDISSMEKAREARGAEGITTAGNLNEAGDQVDK
jgi:hypothetical protein